MKNVFKINPELDIPIYKQLVDAILVAVKSGNLVAGEQLPTVFEMTSMAGVARGTVKKAYDELERIGIVEKVQGRGTFVKYQPVNSGSRKEQAMEAIDEMLDKLENMGLSPSEINIFLNLKLRERSQAEANVKIAVVECNPENLSQMSEQLRHIDEVDLYSYTLDSIKQYPYKLNENYDLIVTTSLHSDYLESIVPDKKRIIRVALRPSARSLSHIIKLKKGEKTGIVGYSERFAKLIYNTCSMYAEEVIVDSPLVVSERDGLEKYLKGKDTILLPKHYEKYFDLETVKAISAFKGSLVECNYEMDEGSVMYLETKIKKIRDSKTI